VKQPAISPPALGRENYTDIVQDRNVMPGPSGGQSHLDFFEKLGALQAAETQLSHAL
jgi:hypothetical protein